MVVFTLKITRGGNRDEPDLEFPFQLVDSPRCLSRLVRATVQSGQGSIIKSLFLMIQSDEFSPKGDGLTRTTNTTVETLWQQTHTAYSQQDKSDHGFIPFPGRQTLAPCFKPLFFCKKKHRFFHPPCPVCGNELTLCRDDKRLTHASLKQFSTSTQRYLACPSCLETNQNPTFYKWSRSPLDGIFVKDRIDLISDFKNLRTPGAQICGFPCTTCPLHSECYILDHRATERISFFAFYPFYMLVFRAPALNAVDFLALAAGADSTPKVSPRFFFKNDKRRFLEILFVKLSFLNRVLDTLGKRTDQPIWSGTGLTAQSLWIDLLEGTTPLPWLWNFRVTMIDLVNTAPGQSHSTRFSTQAFFNFYSTLWFYSLAVNKAQPLERVLNEIDNGQTPLDSPVLSMEQVFWNPDQFQATQTYHDFWIQACTLGLEMRKIQGDSPLYQAINDFSKKTIILHQKIKETLFSTTQNVTMEETETAFSPTENQTLTRMLTSIFHRWSAPPPPSMQPPEMAEQDNQCPKNRRHSTNNCPSDV